MLQQPDAAFQGASLRRPQRALSLRGTEIYLGQLPGQPFAADAPEPGASDPVPLAWWRPVQVVPVG